jgi:hypothetical protein
MKRRVSAAVCALVGAALVVPTAPVAAQPAGPIACPEVRPTSALSPGDTGVGYTVGRGTTPEPFEVEIVDVMANGLAPGVPLIVVDVDSPEIDRVGGIWAGMSGSPVYIDGQLVGAVSYGFSLGPSKLGGVTPAAAMLAVPDRPTLPPPPAPTSVSTSSRVRAHAVAEHGLSRSAAGSMRPLEVPVRLSGPGGSKFDRAARAFEEAHPGTRVVRGSGAAAAPAPTEIVAGGNIGVSLAYGDFTAVGVGTATTVCGDVVTAFGHPMLYDGATRLGMHAASAIRIVDDPTLTPYKLANVVTEPVGTIDQDRLAAVAGRVGVLPPTTAITTAITSRDTSRTTTGRTDAIYPDDLFGAVMIHGWINYDFDVFDDYFFAGTSQVAWTIRGIRGNGAPFSVTRQNRHASRGDLSTESLNEVAAAAQSLHGNDLEEVRITEVDYQADAGAGYRALDILGSRVTASVAGGPYTSAREGVELVPGEDVKVRIPMRRFRAGEETVTVTLEVPDDAEGFGAISVSGGGGGGEEMDPFECLFFPEACGAEADSFEDLLEDLRTRPRNDDLVVSLTLFPESEFEDEEAFSETPTLVTTTRRLADVVTGFAEFPAYVPGDDGGEFGLCEEELPNVFVDVDPSSTHAQSIACAADLGLTGGVSADPPRFAPGRAVTRGQAASFLVRALDLVGTKELPEVGRPRFTDAVGSPHADSIERLAAAGIVRGRTTSRFDPQAPVTREQMATLLIGSLGWATDEAIVPEDGPYFDDVSGVHARNVDAAFERGLIFGRADGTFNPAASTRRDQMATLLVRFVGSLLAVG